MYSLIHFLRSALFVSVFAVATVLYTGLCLLVFPLLSVPKRFVVGRQLNRFVIWWFGFCCGVRYEIVGRENIPHDRVGVLLSNHQSTWETFYLQLAVNPLVTVMKRELLRIPFFGWFLAMSVPIAIDRNQKMGALKQIVSKGVRRISDGFWVLIFPEGTRVDPGQSRKFARTGAYLACEAGAPIVPVAHNAGQLWPNGRWIKYPGVLRIEFGPVIETEGLSVEEVHRRSSQWIEQTRDRIMAGEVRQK